MLKSRYKERSTIEQSWLDIEALENISKVANDGKLKGYSDRYKIRTGNYRIIYKTESENHILITAIAHRKDIYNKLFGLTFLCKTKQFFAPDTLKTFLFRGL